MNFRKTSKRPLAPPTPPALVSESNVTFFSGVTKICNEIFWIEVTHPPPPPPFRKFITFPSQIHPINLQGNLLDRKWTPPPLEVFQKIIHFCERGRPLALQQTARPCQLTHSATFGFWHTKSYPGDLWPFRHLIATFKTWPRQKLKKYNVYFAC